MSKNVCYTYEGYKLTSKQLVNRIRDEIIGNPESYKAISSILYKVNINPQTEIEDRIKKIKKSASSDKYIGVKKYISMKHKITDSPTDEAVRIVPEYIEDNRIKHSVEILVERGNIRELAEQEILAQLEDEKLDSLKGSLVHGLIEALFKNNGSKSSEDYKAAIENIKKSLDKTTNEDGDRLDQNGKTLREIITTESSISDSEIINIFEEIANKIYSDIKDKPEYQNAVFLSEFDLYADDVQVEDPKYKGLHGIADLIVIKEDGTVDIIDFKISNSYFEGWCAAKRYDTEYQLGIYRAMLAQHGINPNNVGLYVKPIFMNRTKVDNWSVQATQNLLLSGAGESPYSRLSLIGGKFAEIIEKLIHYKPVNITLSSSVKVNNEALDKFTEMLDYRPIERSYDRDKLIEKVHEKIKGEKLVYTFYDRLIDQVVENSSKEFFTKKDGYIDNYILRCIGIKNEWVKNIYEKLKEYKADNNTTKYIDFDFLHTKGKTGSGEIIMQTIFGEFCKPYYDLLEDPILIENGIIGVRDKRSGLCKFVILTNNSLSSTYSEGKYGNLLGAVGISNDEIRQMNGVQTLLANCQNAELMKVVHILNSIADSNPDWFDDKTIGNVTVISPNHGYENNSLPLQVLLTNYNILCNKTKTTNHFNDTINLANEWTQLAAEMKYIESQYEEDPSIHQIVKSFSANTHSAYGKIQQLIRLRAKMEKLYPKFQHKTFTEAQRYDLNDPIDHLFITVNSLIETYQKIPIDPSGRFDKYGFHASSIMELVGMPFQNNQSFIDSQGRVKRGIGSGLYMTSAENSVSPTLKALAEYYQIAYSKIREDFLKAHKAITDLTIPFIGKNESKISQNLFGVNTSYWERLLVKDSKGNISSQLMLKDPYSDQTLSEDDRTFLKGILWEINKYRFSEFEEFRHLNYKDNAKEIEDLLGSESNLIKCKQSGRYFELPLKRARWFERWKQIGRKGLGTLLKEELETLREDWDMTKMVSTQRSQMMNELRKNSTTMYNQYDISKDDREFLIQKEGIESFEVDLDLLALDVAFQTIRKNYFENVLQTTAACATMLHLTQSINGVDRHVELEALEDRATTSVKGASIINEEGQEIGKGITALRKLNSLLVLAFRPLQLVKELTFGQLTNFSRALSSIGSSEKFTIKSIFEANKIIWGQSLGKWGTIFTTDASIASLAMCEQLNKLYGIANEDLNRLVDSSRSSRQGFLGNISRYMYWANTVPDYFNRLTLFISKMIQDGCWEAHSLNEKGELVYDFKKDKRFSELAKYGLNSNHNSELYRQQKGLYLAMAEQFAIEGDNYITYDKNGNPIYQEFKKAYTTKQRNSLKEVADMAYGYYDHEIKSLVDLGFFGLIWKQFQTFITAKTNLWFRGRPTTKGDNTAQGKFIQIEIDGEKCYNRIVTNENGDRVIKIVKESELTPEEKGKLDYAYTWQGDYVEGLVYSIMGTLYDLFHLNFKEIKNNKYRLGNLCLALHDILVGMILYAIFKWLWSGGTKKMQDIKPLQRVLLRSMQDVSPTAIASTTWEPGFWSSVVNLRDDALRMFSEDDPDIEKFFTHRIGAVKDWTWNEH